MTRRSFTTLTILAAINSALFLFCYLYLWKNPGAGPEGIGIAITCYASLFASVLIGGVGLNCLLEDVRQRKTLVKGAIATGFGVAPIFLYLIFDKALHLFR